MILRIEDIKDICNSILQAVDNNEISTITETLELKLENKLLIMAVTNKEYFAEVTLKTEEEDSLHATVNANLFLKLIAKLTTDTVELMCNENNLIIKANGSYKLPLIFENEHLMELPKITINNPTVNMNIKSSILHSIMTYNSKELLRGTPAIAAQKLFYIDDKGAITFMSGACVNNFTLEKPLKLLLNSRLVKLFKLFKTDNVNFTLGHDEVNNLIQTKVKFESGNIKITAMLPNDDAIFNSIPVEPIRERAAFIYPYSVVINRVLFLQAIDRLLLFNGNNTIKPYSIFEFNKDSVVIYDHQKANNETLLYSNEVSIEDSYRMILDLVDLKTVLESCNDQYITLNFGNHEAIVIARNTVFNIIPEIGE